MKALVYTGPQTLAFTTWPDPEPARGEVLVRVEASGICGSDMHAWLGHDDRRQAPLILGHEAAGIIVGGSRDGERVTINPLVACGQCRACQEGRDNLCATRQVVSLPPRAGTFAQLVAVPEKNLVSVPDRVPLSKAALAEPLAVSWHSVRIGLEALHGRNDVSALILGGGAIGLGVSFALRIMGITDIRIVEPNAIRRGFLVQKCGDTVLDAAGYECDLVFDAVGLAETRRTASALTKPGGAIVHIGLAESAGGLDIRRMTLQEITFIGTYTYTGEHFRQAATAIFDNRSGDLDWFETRPLAEGAQAFSDLHAGKVAAPKIILAP